MFLLIVVVVKGWVIEWLELVVIIFVGEKFNLEIVGGIFLVVVIEFIVENCVFLGLIKFLLVMISSLFKVVFFVIVGFFLSFLFVDVKCLGVWENILIDFVIFEYVEEVGCFGVCIFRLRSLFFGIFDCSMIGLCREKWEFVEYGFDISLMGDLMDVVVVVIGYFDCFL